MKLSSIESLNSNLHKRFGEQNATCSTKKVTHSKILPLGHGSEEISVDEHPVFYRNGVCWIRQSTDLFIRNFSIIEEKILIAEQISNEKAIQRRVNQTTKAGKSTLDDILKPPLTNLNSVVIMDYNSFRVNFSIFHTRQYRRSYLWVL